jgi:hypothetical protein
MGLFSWKTSDTQRSISCTDSTRGAFPVYLVTPDNEKILETEYEGYGRFGGFDAYALLAKWNKPELCTGNPDEDRSIGIDIGCYDEQNASLKYPLKFAENPEANYEDLPAAKSCEYQGFFYDDWDDEGGEE